MADKDLQPLTPAIIKALNDKLYEKRKVGALEIERIVKDMMAAEHYQSIESIIRTLGRDFANANTPQPRNGGLIGLAACAIALGKESYRFAESLVKPPLGCFSDPDSRVRYYACESLYNICKVARGSILPYFNEIFDGLSKLADDTDANVRNGSELLDRLVKDIVAETVTFNLPAFIPLLRDRIYAKKPFSRRFVVSWVSLLNAVPDIDMLVFLPEFIDGLFVILGDPSSEIRKQTEQLLADFLVSIAKAEDSKTDFATITNFLIIHSQSKDDLIQFHAVSWLEQFLLLAKAKMLPFGAGILKAILPCLSYDDQRKSTREAAKNGNDNLMKLIVVGGGGGGGGGRSDHGGTTAAVTSRSGGGKSTGSGEAAMQQHEPGAEAAGGGAGADSGGLYQLDFDKVVQVLMHLLGADSMPTKIAVLRWFLLLFTSTPSRVFSFVQEIFPLLLTTLSDVSDEVVLTDLDVLAEIASSAAGQKYCRLPPDAVSFPPSAVAAASHHTHFVYLMKSLLTLFSRDRYLLEDRGAFIIRHLCVLLDAESVYRTIAELMHDEQDLDFASTMVRTLNIILLTSTELFELRNLLKDVETQEGRSLFACLYQSWCHNPVATVSLCFLTRNYRHSCNLLQLFERLDVTVELLAEIDKLVQLIESPIFIYLRLQLLDHCEDSTFLVKSLYSLLMLLPQSDAFTTLHKRLQCVPPSSAPLPTALPSALRLSSSAKSQEPPTSNRMTSNFPIDFDALLDHFNSIQQLHRDAKRRVHAAKLRGLKEAA